MLYDKRWDAKIALKESEMIEQLKTARERVAAGWCQKVGSNWAGAVCAQIAITGGNHEDYMAGKCDAAINALRLTIGCVDVVGWNDAPGRTQAEVVAAFDKAIELARQ